MSNTISIGSTVYVTGDTAGYEHQFDPGTEVTIVADDYLLDGSYLCSSDDDETWWVAASDLNVEPVPLNPEPVATASQPVADLVNPTPRYTRGDIVVNHLSGREAVILGSKPFGTTTAYEVIEKGFVYPKGSAMFGTPGAATFLEEFLTPFGQSFSEEETDLIVLSYVLGDATPPSGPMSSSYDH